jgi:zinc transport system ATP-binding protein
MTPEQKKDFAIMVDNVTFAYDNEIVLNKVSLHVPYGDFVGVIGPNGGGKTTLIRCILGILTPMQGTIRLLGDSPVKTRMFAGYVPQETSSNKLFPISVFDVVLMGKLRTRKLFHRYTREDREAAEAVLSDLKLSHLKNKAIGDLSGGQRQKVLLARSLVAQPRILFLDEPTASIDSKGQSELYTYLRDINGKGTTIVLITHNISTVSSYIKSIACVNQELFFHPDGILSESTVSKTFGCPVDIVAHGLPHRVYHTH